MTSNDRESFERFMKAEGSHATVILNSFVKLKVFHDVLNTEIGRVLLVDLATRCEKLLEKIIALKATKEEIIEYKVCRDLTEKWTKRIDAFLKRKGQIFNRREER